MGKILWKRGRRQNDLGSLIAVPPSTNRGKIRNPLARRPKVVQAATAGGSPSRSLSSQIWSSRKSRLQRRPSARSPRDSGSPKARFHSLMILSSAVSQNLGISNQFVILTEVSKLGHLSYTFGQPGAHPTYCIQTGHFKKLAGRALARRKSIGCAIYRNSNSNIERE